MATDGLVMGPSRTGWPGMRGSITGTRARETWPVKAVRMAAAMRLSVGVGTRTGGAGVGAATGMVGGGGAARAGVGALVRVVVGALARVVVWRGLGVCGSPDSEVSVADRVLRLESGAAGAGTVVAAGAVVGVVGVDWWGVVGEA